MTRARVLRVGRDVHAVGVVLPATLSHRLLGCPASEFVDRTVSLDAVWPSARVERLLAALHLGHDAERLSTLRDALVSGPTADTDMVVAAARAIMIRGGDASVAALAAAHQVSRQQFTRRFRAARASRPNSSRALVGSSVWC